MLHGRKAVRVLHHEVGAGQRRGRVAAREAEAVADVGAGLGLERREIGEVAGQRLARVHQRRRRRQGLLERDGRPLGRVVHLDQVQRGGRGRLVDGGHRRHGLALEARDVDSEDRTVAERRPIIGIAPGEVGAAEHGEHAGQRASARGLDARDARMRVRRAEDTRVGHARQDEVGHVAGAPCNLLDRIHATNRVPDYF